MASHSQASLATASAAPTPGAAAPPVPDQTTAPPPSPSESGFSTARAGKDEAAIRAAMAAYNAALNAGDTDAVLPLYAQDGIFMAPYSPSAEGQAAIRTAYDKIFEELKFDVKFDIAELVLVSPAYAYVRTNSAGTTVHASTGKSTAEANQELFIFGKGRDGNWRIARYSFSPVSPPARS